MKITQKELKEMVKEVVGKTLAESKDWDPTHDIEIKGLHYGPDLDSAVGKISDQIKLLDTKCRKLMTLAEDPGDDIYQPGNEKELAFLEQIIKNMRYNIMAIATYLNGISLDYTYPEERKKVVKENVSENDTPHPSYTTAVNSIAKGSYKAIDLKIRANKLWDEMKDTKDAGALKTLSLEINELEKAFEEEVKTFSKNYNLPKGEAEQFIKAFMVILGH
jgi:hypothetical protein